MTPPAALTDLSAYQRELMTEIHKTIKLLPVEKILREFLLEGASRFPGLEIWIVGGWVRDRLLGIPSSDLDLALNNLTGREFGAFLEAFSTEPEIEAKYRQKLAGLGIADTRFAKFHVVERNVDKAKKLETAGGKLFGLNIDLVNLRTEVYDGSSRTPSMEFGTPEEDAFRRDATINSIFFHLQKQKIVDLTGRGLADLEAKIIKTPLDPRQTFMDDPLRVLRLIRVGSKLGFTIDPTVMKCMQDNDIRCAFNTMITRDRVGAELFKIIQASNPAVAFQCIFEANLYTPVFVRLNSSLLSALSVTSAPALSRSSPWPAAWPRAYRILEYLLTDSGNLGKMVQLEPNYESLWIMAAYAPFGELRFTMCKQAAREAMLEIRGTKKNFKFFENALKNYDSIQLIVNSIAEQSGKSLPRSFVGAPIRSWGPTWIAQVTYVMLSQAVCDWQSLDIPKSSERSCLINDPITGPLLKRYASFANFVQDHDLQDAHLQRPVLNGNNIRELFGLDNGSKLIRSAINALLEWQFDHVGCEIGEAKAWLLDQRERLGVPSTATTRPA